MKNKTSKPTKKAEPKNLASACNVSRTTFVYNTGKDGGPNGFIKR